MKLSKIGKAVAGSFFVLSATVAAEVNLSGFATFAGGLTTASDERLYEYDNDFSFDQNSLLGIQIDADLGEGITAVAQLVSKGANEWDMDVEWAYLGYEINDNWKIIAGRQRAPFYMYSDFLDVGYAYHWITPPEGVYDLPFTSIDGVNNTFDFSLGDWDSSVSVLFGRNTQTVDVLGQQVASDFENTFIGSWTLNYDFITLRASYSISKASMKIDDLTPLLDTFNSLGLNDIADNFEVKEDDASFWGLGVNIDYNNYMLVAEYTNTDAGENMLAEQSSYYITAGKRFDNILPYVTYGVNDDDGDTNGLDGFPDVPALEGLYNVAMSTLESQSEESKYVQVGLRWDFHPSTAFKVDYTHYDDENNNNKDAGLVRFALSTVF